MSSNRVLYVVGAIALAAVLLLAPVFFISGPNPVVEIETSNLDLSAFGLIWLLVGMLMTTATPEF